MTRTRENGTTVGTRTFTITLEVADERYVTDFVRGMLREPVADLLDYYGDDVFNATIDGETV